MIALSFAPAGLMDRRYWIATEPDGEPAGLVQRSRLKDPRYSWEARLRDPSGKNATRPAGFADNPQTAMWLLVSSYAFHVARA